MQIIRRLIVLTAFAACGCMRTCPRTISEAPLSFAPLRDRAQVVFLVSRAPPSGTCILVLDEQRDVIGALGGQEYFVAAVEPGWHRFIVRADDRAPDVIEGDLGPGRVYYALVEWRGFIGYGGIAASILAPRSREDRWSHLSDWMERARPSVRNDEAARAATGALNFAALEAASVRRIESFDELQRDEHTWLVEDGWAPSR